MIRMMLLLTTMALLQRGETFGEFYFNKFMVDRKFREQRIKFPLNKAFNTNKVTIDNAASLNDTLIVATSKPVFVAQGKVEVVFWQTEYYNMENVFTKNGNLWYLTEIRIKPL